MANPTIGYITCPLTGETDCDVRRYSTGKKSLYYVGSAGKITPNLPAGQAYMKKHTRFINGNDEPLPVAENPVNEKQGGENPVNEKPKKSPLAWFLSADDEIDD